MGSLTDLYRNFQPHLVAVDCIIFGFIDSELHLLIFKRGIEPGRGKWSLMGGFVGVDESLDEAAFRILYELTGLKDLYMTQLYTHGEIDRDPGARVISTSYYSLIKVQDLDPERAQISNARWCPFSELPELIFDHSKMVEMALESLRSEAHRKPIGFELLPPKFTLPQLQSLYEAIYQQHYDKRNFRKNILRMDLLEKLEEKDKENSRKGAWLYRFNEEKYKEFLRQGFFFNIPV
jgi:ADP-ribose pyrophosphatase YjhB (NUDIX family)